MLGDVYGRHAGSVAGYPYSAALAHADITWDAATLDKWLAGPQNLVPGAEMPFSLPDAIRRRDIIAYLQSLKPKTAGQTERAAATHPG
jgi:cytochrome c2